MSFEDNELGAFWPLYQGQNQVGRKDAAEGLDIEIDHPTTSSRHAVLHARVSPNQVEIEDKGSTNGTFHNDQKLNANVRHKLKDGDKLRFGGYTVTVKIV